MTYNMDIYVRGTFSSRAGESSRLCNRLNHAPVPRKRDCKGTCQLKNTRMNEKNDAMLVGHAVIGHNEVSTGKSYANISIKYEIYIHGDFKSAIVVLS